MNFTEEQIISIVEDYQKTGSIERTSKNQKLSSGTVRKMLLTAGVWSNKTAKDIAILRREHPDWTNSQIAEHLKISQKAVQLYSPYEGLTSMAWINDDRVTRDAEIIDFGDCGDKATWTLTGSGRLTISGSGAMWDYSGNTYGKWGEKRPKWWSRKDNINVKSIEIQEGITSIGEYAFSGMSHVNNVILPSSLTEIHGAAFCGENQIRKIVIPEKVEYIAWDTFFLNIFLEEIHIPASVYKIQTYAFHACVSLKRMYFYGNAPRTSETTFDMCHGGFTIYHKEGAKGFGEVWNGYRTEVF